MPAPWNRRLVVTWSIAGIGFLFLLLGWVRSLSHSDLLVARIVGDWHVAVGSSNGSLLFLLVAWPEGDWFAIDPGYRTEPLAEDPLPRGQLEFQMNLPDSLYLGFPWWILALLVLLAVLILVFRRRRAAAMRRASKFDLPPCREAP